MPVVHRKKMISTQIINEISDNIQSLSEEVRMVSFDECREHTISFSALSCNQQSAYLLQLSDWEKENICSSYIYIIKADKQVDLAACYTAFSEAKARKKDDRAYSRLNDKSNVFYVGSSISLSKRIKEHLGLGSMGTYALQMRYWALGQQGNLAIEIYRFGNNVSTNAIQAIEDGLWEIHSPMFGRKGAR